MFKYILDTIAIQADKTDRTKFFVEKASNYGLIQSIQFHFIECLGSRQVACFS